MPAIPQVFRALLPLLVIDQDIVHEPAHNPQDGHFIEAELAHFIEGIRHKHFGRAPGIELLFRLLKVHDITHRGPS